VPRHSELDSYGGPEPDGVNEYLQTRHGDGYMGFQSYRLVHSESVYELSAGEWCDWDENLPVEARGKIVAGETGKELVADTRCERRVVEMRRIPKYGFDRPGWILERWVAPAYFGSPSWWESQLVEGTKIPKLGPYPHRGAYVSILPEGMNPWPEAPTGPFLDRFIELWEVNRDELLAYTAAAYTRKRDYEARDRDKTRSENWNRDVREANMTALQPFFSTYLDGGKARQLAAEHAGLTSNYGN
jgi:hypothetical protein